MSWLMSFLEVISLIIVTSNKIITHVDILLMFMLMFSVYVGIYCMPVRQGEGALLCGSPLGSSCFPKRVRRHNYAECITFNMGQLATG